MKRDNITLTLVDELFLLDSQIANLKRERGRLAEQVKTAILATHGEAKSLSGVLARYTLVATVTSVVDVKRLKEVYPDVYTDCLVDVTRESLRGFALSIH